MGKSEGADSGWRTLQWEGIGLFLRPDHTCLAVRFWREKGIERMKRDVD